MVVTKYQAKQLQYKARANKSALYSTKTSDGCKVKHREFPSYNLSYDESKDSSGNRILTNVVIDSVPFNGTYDELLAYMNSRDNSNMGVVNNCPTMLLEAVVPTHEESLDCSNYVELPTIGSNAKFTYALESNGVLIEETESGKQPDGPMSKKTLSRMELNDLRIKCATMKLATMYGESEKSSIADIIGKYPDAVINLNRLYAQDKIKPYTISEESIKESYPNEYHIVMESLD